MLWLNFLHLYQPVNKDDYVIKEATEKSYLRVVRGLEEHPNIHFTFNITGCLFLRWEDLGYFDLIKRIKKLVQKGRLELTGSAAYHPLLPLIDKKEVKRQIQENEEILKKYLGKDFKLKGFFLPELAYSPEVAKIIKSFGYKWILLDEFAYNGHIGKVDFGQVYIDGFSGLKIIFRSRKFSNNYVPEIILKLLNQKIQTLNTIITATDGELYGLRHNDPDAIFEQTLKRQNLDTLTFSEFIEQHPAKLQIKPITSSWETTKKDLKVKKPFSLWYDPANKIQMKLWELTNFACSLIEKNKKDKNYYWARWHLVRGLASCTFWWASARDFRHVFGPISWGPDEIERGLNEFIRAIRSLDNPYTKQDKLKAEKMCSKIRLMVWTKHWNEYWPLI